MFQEHSKIQFAEVRLVTDQLDALVPIDYIFIGKKLEQPFNPLNRNDFRSDFKYRCKCFYCGEMGVCDIEEDHTHDFLHHRVYVHRLGCKFCLKNLHDFNTLVAVVCKNFVAFS